VALNPAERVSFPMVTQALATETVVIEVQLTENYRQILQYQEASGNYYEPCMFVIYELEPEARVIPVRR
jgi:hypothetical protein